MKRKLLDFFCYVFIFGMMLFFADWILDILAQ